MVSLLDHDEPDQILAHLMVGSEGTLGFVLSATYRRDTGALTKKHRAARHTATTQAVGAGLAKAWGRVLPALRLGVGVNDAAPTGLGAVATGAARVVLPEDVVPLIGEDLPGPGISRRTTARREPGDVVLFASCISELFGPADDGAGAGIGAGRAFLALCDRAGVPVQIPAGVESLCCGTMWRSKGLTAGAQEMARRTATALLEATREGQVPVVSDASSCTHGLHELESDLRKAGDDALADRLARVDVVDAVAFVAEHVAPRLPRPPAPDGTVVVHPTCSDRRAGGVKALTSLAARCGTDVVVPPDTGCCGFAGDRGMLHPELTAAATRPEALDVAALGPGASAYVSTNRTCELGMTRATGRVYRHVLEVLEESTR